ncbi:hypothetical protein, partial [Yoonia maritima]|uniref:hypothetical protein n=1 Tax=Yoonia maritima TaxID=1435347 RepID=UPI001A9C43B3
MSASTLFKLIAEVETTSTGLASSICTGAKSMPSKLGTTSLPSRAIRCQSRRDLAINLSVGSKSQRFTFFVSCPKQNANVWQSVFLRAAGFQSVRRQVFWNQSGPKLRESLAHLVGLIMRRVGG